MGETGEQVCRAAVEGKLEEWGWQLVPDHAAFGRAICDELAPMLVPLPDNAQIVQIRRAAILATIRLYGPLLFKACNSPDPAVVNRAFTELGAYLYRLALDKTFDEVVAHDCVQQALETIWRKLSQVRAPSAFVYWCRQVLLTKIKDHYREFDNLQEAQKSIHDVENDQEISDGEQRHDSGVEPGTGQAAPEPFEIAVQAQMRAQLIAALRTCLTSEQQVQVVIRVLLDDHGYKQVADELGTTPLNVQVMKSRALAKLRTCEEVMSLYEQWFKL